jgi:hypothetical protein
MKTLKVEEVYLMEYETFEDVAATAALHRRRVQCQASPLGARLQEPRHV